MSDANGESGQSRNAEAVFEMLDADGNGAINPSDLRIAMDSLGLEFTSTEIERLIKELDPAGTGSIDFQHFAELINEKMSEREETDRVQMAFEMLDEDRTGKITFENLKRVAESLGEEITDPEIREMINEADTDNDGAISYEEFVALVRTAQFG